MAIAHPIVVLENDHVERTALAMLAGGATGIDGVSGLGSEIDGPSLLVVGPSFSDDEGIAAVGAFLRQHAAVGAVLVAHTLTTEILQSALRAGFRDVLAEPVEQAQLLDTLGRVSAGLPSPHLPSTAGGEPASDRGRLITVFSTKGGAGKSMLASNIAVSLAQRESRPVVLLDADLQFGDICVMLKLAPRHTVVDAVSSVDRLDTALLRDLLIEHPASGLLVLSAPLEPALADQITAVDLLRVVELLRSMAAFVVVDTPAYFNDVVLGLIEESDDVVLLAGMDIPNIKNVRIGLQTLRLLGTPMSKIRLVLNRANSKVKLDGTEVERTLQVKVECRIPSDVAVPQSINKGVPIVRDAPKSGPAKAIEGLVTQLMEETVR